MEDTQVIITVDPAAEFETVKRRCEEVGLGGVLAMPPLHLLTGSIAPDRLDILRHLGGVVAVELQRRYQLPPRDSPIQ